MNKLEKFLQRLDQAGLTPREVGAVVEALNEYNNTRFEEQYVQQGKEAHDAR